MCVCVWSIVQQNINAKFKDDKYFVDEVKTLVKRKTTLGQPNLRNLIFRRQSKLQGRSTHITRYSSRTFNNDTYLYMNASQPDVLFEGVFDGLL